MEKYLNRAFLWDTIIAILIGAILYLFRPYLSDYLDIPSMSDIDKIGTSLISIGVTLIGFLLTIITIIVTFKKGFDAEEKTVDTNNTKEIGVPETTVFGKIVSKEDQFYGTPLYKKVLHVFIGVTYEISFVILILLIVQFNLVPLSQITLSLITLGCLIMILLSGLRSINIFKLYLNVHTVTKTTKS